MRLADYVADFLLSKNIDHTFSVVGGGSMYLNDALGHAKGMHVTYMQHEQAASMAAEGWARIKTTPAAVCVTSGPGGVNAMNGVLGAWLDSIPMFVLSGQVRYATTIESTGLNLRQQGEQEYTIIESVRPMTKYAVMVKDASLIKYHLERAYWEATHGRRGPVWLDIPLDVQNTQIEPSELKGFDPGVCSEELDADIAKVIDLLNSAKRPVLVGGSAVRSSQSLDAFQSLAHELGMPVVTATSIADIFPWSDPLYMGMFGILGGRAGNYAIQEADLILVFGCSLSYRHTGFNYEAFAPKAKIVSINCEPDELKKPNVAIDLPIVAEIESFIPALRDSLDGKTYGSHEWLEWCQSLKEKYPTYQSKFKESEKVNQYEFANELLKKLSPDGVMVLSNSIASVSFLQMGIVSQGQRCFGNVNCGSMGWDLPAGIGAAIALNNDVWVLAGDGSVQMNLQELQTIAFNNIPIKLVVFNNGGYQCIVASQTNAFGRICGCTPECGEGVPSFEGVAAAYGIPYFQLRDNAFVPEAIDWCMEQEGPVLCEVMQADQGLEPKIMSRRMPDGSMSSPILTDLSPFLSEDEISEINSRWS